MIKATHKADLESISRYPSNLEVICFKMNNFMTDLEVLALT